ncbi:tyrosine--tRNA ligase 2, cytoplasmic isoform X3 [Sorghum bicolor]|uniref:tyrosine--tRNA ligase 2, cytoplasmic isoform X3 n=1 Tax=Sorghum bicolor TaxID=4558 RepID=UPI000B424426|nr:tyrosine--tRNA ligase 2, cytoplasmic isoform X3 [Sorghum bicolor]|eukprot:XP_021319236.1 tyrosine--tRNA ligase 2, cytoplasmic isoform X3 [Sorghum bicolor]
MHDGPTCRRAVENGVAKWSLDSGVEKKGKTLAAQALTQTPDRGDGGRSTSTEAARRFATINRSPLDFVRVEAMLARASGFVGKAWKRTPNLSVQVLTSPRRCSYMPPQLRHLHSTPTQREILPEEQQLLQNNSVGALPRLDCISKENWSKQRNNVNMQNSAVAAVDSIRDTVEGSFDQRFATLKSIGEDRVNDRELELLLKRKSAPICYVWCDPSPWMHISEGIIKTLCVNKMVNSGCKVKILMTDWLARMDDNIGGNLNKMRNIGLYNIEIWKAVGMALDRVELVWLSDEINRHANKYWPLAMDVSRKTTVHRIKRCYRNRDPFEEFTAADIFYPSLQCATILFQKVDIWLLGRAQHEANLLAREYCKRVRRGNEPIALSHIQIYFRICYCTLKKNIGGIHFWLSTWKILRLISVEK